MALSRPKMVVRFMEFALAMSMSWWGEEGGFSLMWGRGRWGMGC